MDADKLNIRIQIVGVIAVVASLIFVGLQLKQTQQIALAGQYQERSAMAMEYWIGVAQDEDVVRGIGQRFMTELGPLDDSYDQLTHVQFGKQFIYTRMTFTALDNHHFQYSAGFYDEATWQSFRAQLQSFISTNNMAKLLLRRSGGFFRADFRELCEEILASAETDSSQPRIGETARSAFQDGN